MDSYYDAKKEFFYFEEKDLLKYIAPKEGSTRLDFRDCDTKQKAIDRVCHTLSSVMKETRMLRVSLGMPSSLYTIPNPKFNLEGDRFETMGVEKTILNPEIPKYLLDILTDNQTNVYNSKGLTVQFERLVKLDTAYGTEYSICNKEWEFRKGKHSNYFLRSEATIEWTQEREKFLVFMQDRLDSLAKQVLDFFNAGDDINNLLGKLDSGAKLLEK